ncbi:MAG: hypothetical protein C4547_14315 [Phycisphaerales bacterium]|nr:MAG: hypothetical protein C4547_14315 [Phycisphaerales bacterium]
MKHRRFTIAAALLACGGWVVAPAAADELKLDPGKPIKHYTSNSNDGYSTGRGMVFTAQESFELTGLGLYTKAESTPLNATLEVYKIVVTRGNVLAGATLVGKGTGPLRGPLEYHNVDLDAAVNIEDGASYLVRFLYPEAAQENWFYDFDPVRFGDPPVDLGLVLLIDGTQGGNTGNFVAPPIQLVYSSGCKYTIKKSKAKGGCNTCPAKGDSFSSGQDCEVVEDCDKKVKGKISCPGGGNGFCKIKGKRSSCG